MSRPARRKVYPLSMRLPEADVAVIDRAAALRGRSRTDFVREAAVRAAEAALLEEWSGSHERERFRRIHGGDIRARRGGARNGRRVETLGAVGFLAGETLTRRDAVGARTHRRAS